ncbi:YqcI/YcgG family protein [Salinibacillus xinjiangensis]|nr:YqcI/YcgG family protein [Salinibacillus xinjiangensis]
MIQIKELYQNTPTNQKQLNPWEKSILKQFEAKMSDKDRPFPCIPATIGFSLNHLRYGFIGDPRKHTTILELSSLLKTFTEVSRNIGNYASLIVFYEIPVDMKNNYSVEQYEQLFWYQLNELAAIDDEIWPEEIPTDPHRPLWEFCFHGEKYFMFCATPAHTNRRSRHFNTMMLAITPRWVLKEFNKSQNQAKRIKERIRRRLSQYDSISVHPDLNSYGAEDNFEWRQYFIRDDDTSLSKCPFHQFLNIWK